MAENYGVIDFNSKHTPVPNLVYYLYICGISRAQPLACKTTSYPTGVYQ